MRSTWPQQTEQLSERAFGNELLKYGFHAVVINKKGYAVEEFQKVTASLDKNLERISIEHDFLIAYKIKDRQ